MQAQRRVLSPPRPSAPAKVGSGSGNRASDETPLELPRGTVLFGKYVVERSLGAGGMGLVLGVRHSQLGELFAMKVLREKALRKHPKLAVRFLNEARAAAQLRSDHVVRVYDVGTLDSGSPYMMMEHLEGRDLGAVIEEDGPLPAADVIEYMLQALDAITEAHTVGIIHRDLKPDNLFLATRPNGGFVVKVLDFGISKQVDSIESGIETGSDSGVRAMASGERLTGASGIMGSPYYMSPEQMSCESDVDVRADIWGLGVIMYELLTGAPPFTGTNIAQIYASVLTGNSTPLLQAAPNTPPRLASLVERCLKRERSERPQTAAELMAELEEIQADCVIGDSVQRDSAEVVSNKILQLTETVDDVPAMPGDPEVIVEWLDRDPVPAGPDYLIQVDDDADGPSSGVHNDNADPIVMNSADDITPPLFDSALIDTQTNAKKGRAKRPARKLFGLWMVLVPASLTVAVVCVVGKAAVAHAAHEVVSFVYPSH